MDQGVLRRQDLVGRPGRARPARAQPTGAGIPAGQAGSQAGWAGTCRVETITRLASAWRTSLTRRLVTGIGRGADLDRDELPARRGRDLAVATPSGRPPAVSRVQFVQGQPI